MGCEQKNDLFVEENNSGLSITSQSIIATYIFDFIKNEYSLFTEHAIVEEICKAALELFKSMKQKDSTMGGIVSIKITASQEIIVCCSFQHIYFVFRIISTAGQKERDQFIRNYVMPDVS